MQTSLVQVLRPKIVLCSSRESVSFKNVSESAVRHMAVTFVCACTPHEPSRAPWLGFEPPSFATKHVSFERVGIHPRMAPFRGRQFELTSIATTSDQFSCRSFSTSSQSRLFSNSEKRSLGYRAAFKLVGSDEDDERHGEDVKARKLSLTD